MAPALRLAPVAVQVNELAQTLLDAVYEYQRLLHRRKALGIALDPEDSARISALRRLLAGQAEGRPSTSPGQRLEEPLPVHLTVPGGFRAGQLRSVSAGGMALVVRVPRGVRRTVVQVSDASSGSEYVFPGRVVWSNRTVVGVSFDGPPSRSAIGFGESPFGAWKSPLGVGFSTRIERKDRPSSPSHDRH